MSPGIELDVTSLLVGVPASTSLADLEEALLLRGCTLGVALDGAATVGDWLARGAKGAPSLFADPADHLVAGLLAVMPDGSRLEVRPGPRRAVGPDLLALFVGAHGRTGAIEHAWLRVHLRGAHRPALPTPQGADLDPPPSEAEARLFEAIVRELGRAPRGAGGL